MSGRFTCAMVTAVVIATASPASAVPIPFDEYLEFSFTDVGVDAVGCDPEDPAGGFCIPSSGTLTLFLGAPPWTLTAPAGGAKLTVTDAFLSGDRFEIFDFGISLGLTSLPTPGSDCGDDPIPCLADAAISHAVFLLASGDHSLTIVPTLSPFGGGSGYLRVGARPAVPEPGTLVLLSMGLGFVTVYRKRRHTR